MTEYTSVADFISKSTGLTIKPTGDKDCLLGEEYDFFDRSNNQLHVWMRESADTVQLSIIKALQTRTGIGTKFINALRQYSDHSGKKLIIPDTTGPSQPYWKRFNWLVDDTVRIDDCGHSYWPPNTKSYTPLKQMNKTVYIAGQPEALKENNKRMEELGSLLRENGYQATGRQDKEPWQMTREEYQKTAVPLSDRKDFLKAWLQDNEDIPDLVKPDMNYIPLRGYASIVYGNERGQAAGVITFAKDAVQHIAVSDRYKGKGIGTDLLEETRKHGVRRVAGPVSPEFAGMAHKFMVRSAFLEGKPVPPYVLREYPDLAMKAQKQKWRGRV